MGVELPPDIADILDPISEEEDAALVKAMEEGLESELVSEECVMAILRGEDGRLNTTGGLHVISDEFATSRYLQESNARLKN